VSPGTERMLVDFAKAGFISKARQQPDKVKQVLEKVHTDGLMPTIEAVRNKLDQPLALGYCNVGVVVEIGDGVEGFRIGDRVVSNGNHAEYVNVPKNLCACIPDGVTDDAAALTVIGSIALQGLRLIGPTLGESIAVIGLGLIGQCAVQLLHASGCRVIGIDLDQSKIKLAQDAGAAVVDAASGADAVSSAIQFARGRGVDAVLIAASTTSNEPISHAARMCRKRGRIVLVGVVGMQISRADFYDKELSFQVSCSYGPGRYDSNYEERGNDYPVGYVRWTEQRNFEAVLDMLATGKIHTGSLISHRFRFRDALGAYDVATNQKPLGILLEFDQEEARNDVRDRDVAVQVRSTAPTGSVRVGFVGSGNYASGTLVPAFARTSVALAAISSTGGVSAAHVARKYGIALATTETSGLIASTENNVLVIATRHDTHAGLVCEALAAGKHVFVEKPLAITEEDLELVQQAHERWAAPQGLHVIVGFNRRFAPLAVRMKKMLETLSEPKSFIVTVNAGMIPADHWTQKRDIGGGRLVGEACHFVDLVRFLAGSEIVSASAIGIGRTTAQNVRDDKTSISLTFADGSFGTVHYLANGNKAFPKERIEVFSSGRILQLDNFRALKGFGWPGFKSARLLRQDKGNTELVAAFVDSIEAGQSPVIPFADIVEVTRTCLELSRSLNT
jgi:predicted dehydrogenase